MKVSTPEILWHGGGLQPGKPDPVLSIDIYSNEILVTSGIDANIPPKGTIRLWKLGKIDSELQFLVEFSDHSEVVNSVRFSPCGKMIASASLGQIIIYTVPNPDVWRTIDDPKLAERTWLRPCLQEIYDMNWSPDSQYVIAGSIDSKAEILRVKDRNTLGLRGHTSYVQGVAWDPMNQMIATQSADRSCRITMLKHREGSMVKLAPKGHSSIKMYGGNQVQSNNNNNNNNNNNSSTSLSTTLTENGQNVSTPNTPTKGNTEHEKLLSGQISPINNVTNTISKGINLFADSTVATCFFRRLSFSPDGSLLVAPTGIFKSKSTNQTSFVTHIFSRLDLSTPVVSLTGLESPSVAVRFSPILYQMIPTTKSTPLFQGDYRMIFAVVTTTSVLIYDTQFFYPLVRINGCHLATINDVAWSSNGETLIFCSSDGYVSFVRFDPNVLGIPIPIENVPNELKQAFPSIYLPNQIFEQSTSPTIIPSNQLTINPPETIVLKRSLEVENVTESISPEHNKDDSTTSSVKKKKRITPITEPINLNVLQFQSSNQVLEPNKQQQQQSPFKIFGVDPSAAIDLTEITHPVSSNIIKKEQIQNNNNNNNNNTNQSDELKVKTKKRITPIVGELTTANTTILLTSSQVSSSTSS